MPTASTTEQMSALTTNNPSDQQHEGVQQHQPDPIHDDIKLQRIAAQRRAVSKLSRDELDDRYLRLHEESIIIKRHARKQEEKILELYKKLKRITKDKVQESGVKHRDLELEEKLEELQEQVRLSGKENETLRNKVAVQKQQIASQAKRPSAYGYVPPRIDTGRAGPPMSAHNQRIKKNMRVQGEPVSSRTPRVFRPDTLPRYGHSLLEEARAENAKLEEIVANLQNKMSGMKQEKEITVQQLRRSEVLQSENMLKLKERMVDDQRTNIEENVELIRLQRELKERSTKITSLQLQYETVEENLKLVKNSHDHLLKELERLNDLLREEQTRNLQLHSDNKQTSTLRRTVLDLQQQVNHLDKEKEILQDANDKLLKSAFNVDREQHYKRTDQQLRTQIAQLEAALKGDLGDKTDILDKLNEEREQHDKVRSEHRDLQVEYFTIKQQYDDLREQMKFFTKESDVDLTELQEALLLIKRRREKGSQDLDFLHKIDDTSTDSNKRISELETELAETVNEMEKIRNMLITQHRINREQQQEVQTATTRLDDYKREYESKLDEYAQLLDIRAARVKKLEKQLRDIAYGTKQYKLLDSADVEGDIDLDDIDEPLNLERGFNLFEIHVSKVQLTPEGCQLIGDPQPTLFSTYEFFEFEVQSTPVMKGPNPEFDFTSQYVVKVDDFLLHYLQKQSTLLELHRAAGTEYDTVGCCFLSFKEMFDKPHGRVYGTQQIISTDETPVVVATVSYWVRLRVPMEQALRLYKERTKALGYVAANITSDQQALQAMDERAQKLPESGINRLHVRVIRCNNINSNRQAVQPCVYVVYKFFDFTDHDTVVIPNSNNPEIGDSYAYPVPMHAELDNYLKTQMLEIFVFDNNSPDDLSFLGKAQVPLVSLAHDKPIRGLFKIEQTDGSENGTIDICLSWQLNYTPPKPSPPKLKKKKGTVVSPDGSQSPPSKVLTTSPVTSPPVNQSLIPSYPEQTPSNKPPRHPETSHQPRPIAESTPIIPASKQQQLLQQQLFRDDDNIDDNYSNRDSTVHQITETPIIAVSGRRMEENMFDDSAPVDEPPIVCIYKGSLAPIPTATQLIATSIIEGSVSPPSASAGPSYDSDDETSDEIGQVSSLTHPVVGARVGVQEPGEVETGETIIQSSPEQKRLNEESEIEDQFLDEFPKDTPVEEVIPVSQQPRRKPVETTGLSGGETSGSEDVMPKKSIKPQKIPSDSVTITLHHLILEANSAAMEDSSVCSLFVEYRFLGYPVEELETPYSLPKPVPGKPASFNFTKVFCVDSKNNSTRRNLLASMLLPDDPSHGKVRFTVVSEPLEENQWLDCDDIGYAYIDVIEMLKDGHDLEHYDLDIHDAKNDGVMIGALNITMVAIDTLRTVYGELAHLKTKTAENV